MRAQDNRSKELSVEMNRLRDAQCYLNLTLFTDADLDKIIEICDSETENTCGNGEAKANENATE